MAQIKSEQAYEAALGRIKALESVVDDDTPTDDPNYLELDMLIDMVEEYEDVHYPIGTPALVDVIRLRMYERGLTQSKVADVLGISAPRLSEIMHGKTEPSLSLARRISQKLEISPSIVLGV